MSIKYNFGFEEVSVYANVVDLIMRGAREGSTHIDLGCGNAAIATTLLSKGIHYVGFDRDEETVAHLKAQGLEVYQLDLNESREAAGEIFSRVEGRDICSLSMIDVIEHLDDGETFLGLIAAESRKRNGFALIVSVPNFSHTDVATKFISGIWNYTETGLLDRTHRVIYTEDNLRSLMEKAGWQEVAASDYRLNRTEQQLLTLPDRFHATGGIERQIRQIKGQVDPNYNVYQFVRSYEAVQMASSTRRHPLVSIVVSSARDLDALVAIANSPAWSRTIGVPLQLVLAHDASTAEPAEISHLFETQRVSAESIPPEILSGKYLLTFTAEAHWSLDLFAKVIERLDAAHMSGVIHAGAGLTYHNDPMADWREFARSMTDKVLNHCLLPCEYLRNFSDPVIAASSLHERAEQVLQAAARTGVRHLGFLSSLEVRGQPLQLVWQLVEEFSLPLVYSALVNSGSEPGVPGVSREQLHSLRNIYNLRRSERTALAATQGQLEETQEKLEETQGKLEEAQGKLEEAQERLEEAQERLEKAHEQVLEARQKLESSERELADATYKFADSERERVAMVNTIGWKVTRPLRFARSIPRRAKALLQRGSSSSGTGNALLAKFRRRGTYVLQRMNAKIFAWSYSRDNLAAVQALSDKRFIRASGTATANQIAELPSVDISVVTFNSAKWIANFFGSLSQQRYPLNKLNIVFVDHGSSDNTLDTLADWKEKLNGQFESFQVIEQGNLGFGAGHDRAISVGHSAYCLVTNLDLEFHPDSLVLVVQAAMQDADGQVASWELRQIPYEHPKYYDPVTLETNWSSHACILIRREAYKQVGGYDDRIFMYAEDVELSYRFRSYGYTLKYVPRAVVRHFTYEHAGQVKPLQFTGSLLGNNYIRLRYGNLKDITVGLMMYALRIIGPEPFPGARKALLGNSRKIVRNAHHFRNGRGKAKAYFPLHGMDYEMIREGAFWKIPDPTYEASPPTVSIITRTYRGRGVLLSQAIRSVLNQTYPSIELVVVEDGGDSQQQLVEQIFSEAATHVNVQFISNAKLGRSAAGNTGLAHATGKFLMFLDDDDLLFADHVETLMAPMLEDIAISATYSLAIEAATDRSSDNSHYVEKRFWTHEIMRQEWDYSQLLDHNFIPIQAILFNRKLYDQRGGFDLELDQLEDWNLWLRYGYQNTFKFIPKTTSVYRIPANPVDALGRHKLLHEAYTEAKSKALEATQTYLTPCS